MTDKSLNTFTFNIENDLNIRIDNYLADKIEQLSRSKISKLIKNQNILVNDKKVKPSYNPESKDIITVNIPPEKSEEIIPQEMDLDIIYEDEYYIALNKPKNLSVHPGAGIKDGTLVNGLLYYTKNLSKAGGSERPGLVHRLDKDTTGAIICAKSDEAHWKMGGLFADRKIYKEYSTFVWGSPNCEKNIDMPIGRSNSDRKKFAVNDKGKKAVTEFEVINNWKVISQLKIILHTGRTHQIRVHMKHCNSPVIGDSVYGNDNGRIKGFNQYKREICKQILNIADRQLLHSRKLVFIHPFSGKEVEIVAPLPGDFQQTLQLLQDNKDLLLGY